MADSVAFLAQIVLNRPGGNGGRRLGRFRSAGAPCRLFFRGAPLFVGKTIGIAAIRRAEAQIMKNDEVGGATERAIATGFAIGDARLAAHGSLRINTDSSAGIVATAGTIELERAIGIEPTTFSLGS